MNIKSKVFLFAACAAVSAASIAKISDGKAYGAWKGVCDQKQKDRCAVVQIVNNNEKSPVGRVVLRKLAQEKNTFAVIVTVPLGVNLRAGLGLAIDGKEIARAPFDVCQDGCIVFLPVKDDVLEKIKKGKELQVAAFVGDQQQNLSFSLSGVTKAINEL